MIRVDYVNEWGEIIEIGDENAGWKKYVKKIYSTGRPVLTSDKDEAKWYPHMSKDVQSDFEALLSWINENKKGYYITTRTYGKNFKRTREFDSNMRMIRISKE